MTLHQFQLFIFIAYYYHFYYSFHFDQSEKNLYILISHRQTNIWKSFVLPNLLIMPEFIPFLCANRFRAKLPSSYVIAHNCDIVSKNVICKKT